MLNGMAEEVSEGMLIHCPPFSEHEVINTGDEDLVFLITYTPSKHPRASSKTYAASSRNIQDIVDCGTLEKIRREVSDLLQLEVAILDKEFKPVTVLEDMNLPWSRLESMRKYESSMTGLDKAFIGIGNVITMVIPVLRSSEVVGYLQCGRFIINREVSFEENLSPVMLKAFREIPLIPKSRLYALQESLEVVGDLVSEIIDTSKQEKNISEKHLRTKLRSGFKSRNINIGSLLFDEEADYPIHFEEELAAKIRSLDAEASGRVVSEIMNFCEKRSLPAYEVREIIGEMVIGITRELYDHTSDRENFSAVRYKYREKLKNCSDYGSAEKLLREFSRDNIGILKNIFLSGKSSLVEKVNLYIESNYSQEISLVQLAEIFYMSPNYLSAVFNEKNGVNLKDFVNRLRIEKAKQLLKDTDLKISEISRRVGYSQMSYFGSIFRKFEGCTPKEYRSAG
jgi:AraC-like DNA-binding protein